MYCQLLYAYQDDNMFIWDAYQIFFVLDRHDEVDYIWVNSHGLHVIFPADIFLTRRQLAQKQGNIQDRLKPEAPELEQLQNTTV